MRSALSRVNSRRRLICFAGGGLEKQHISLEVKNIKRQREMGKGFFLSPVLVFALRHAIIAKYQYLLISRRLFWAACLFVYFRAPVSENACCFLNPCYVTSLFPCRIWKKLRQDKKGRGIYQDRQDPIIRGLRLKCNVRKLLKRSTNVKTDPE